MFDPQFFTEKWLRSEAKSRRCDAGILETCIHAFALLGHLEASGLPFLFKGGTSLLLHLSTIRRLSRDIDIVCGRPGEEVDAVVAQIGKLAPFTRHTEDVREGGRLPNRRHFKFFYLSIASGIPEQAVLLDVVEETEEVHSIVEKPIRAAFLAPTRHALVRVPTIEALLGDKLTAFAPNTTGIPLRLPNGNPGDVQQVAKQLFDVGVLFDEAMDFSEVSRIYDAVQVQEAGYRESRPSRDQTLADTWMTCVGLTARKPALRESHRDALLLEDGLAKMKGHLLTPEYVTGVDAQRLLAAKAAILVAHLRRGKPFNFATDRYAGTAAQRSEVSAASLNGTDYAWMDGIRAVNPAAYYYWHRAVRLWIV